MRGVRVDRIVDIASDGRHLAVDRGFMTVSKDGEEIGRIAIDEIAAVIVHAHSVTYSNNLFVRLARQGAPVVLCGANHSPASVLWSIEGHHAQGARMRAQLSAGRPLQKRLWQLVVQSKIRMQAATLTANGIEAVGFAFLARQVKSGDSANIEAQAARRYWPLMMGADFRRDTAAEGANALLNYGYTIIRSTVARAIIASGLHPTVGIFHQNRQNAFALADDLVEPFRPVVDHFVRKLLDDDVEQVTPAAKAALVKLIAFDLVVKGERSPLSFAAIRLARSLALSFESGHAALDLPDPPSPIDFASTSDSM